jgi:hypothetical protein
LDVGLIKASLEVDVKKLKGLVGDRERGVTPKLNIALEGEREGNISWGVRAEDGRGVDDRSASLVNLKIITRDSCTWANGGKGKIL